MASSKRSCQHVEKKTAAEEVGNWGGGADKNGMSHFIFPGNEALIQCNSIQFIMHNLHQLQDS